MKNVLSRIAFYFLAVGLLIYAASRSLDFIQATLPPGQQILGFLGLLATSGGALCWMAIYLFAAMSDVKRAIAVLGVAMDLLGEIALFTMDTLYRSGQEGMIAQLSQDEIRMVIIGLSGLIALNIVAIFAFHLMDSTPAAEPQRVKEIKPAMEAVMIPTSSGNGSKPENHAFAAEEGERLRSLFVDKEK